MRYEKRVDNCVGLPNSFTTEYTENTEKTFQIFRELCVLPGTTPPGLVCGEKKYGPFF